MVLGGDPRRLRDRDRPPGVGDGAHVHGQDRAIDRQAQAGGSSLPQGPAQSIKDGAPAFARAHLGVAQHVTGEPAHPRGIRRQTEQVDGFGGADGEPPVPADEQEAVVEVVQVGRDVKVSKDLDRRRFRRGMTRTGPDGTRHVARLRRTIL